MSVTVVVSSLKASAQDFSRLETETKIEAERQLGGIEGMELETGRDRKLNENPRSQASSRQGQIISL